MAVNLAASIVRILHPNGATAGTGFVVSEAGLLATCAHVVPGVELGVDGAPLPCVVSV